MSGLHVFSNGCEWVVAADAGDVSAVLAEFYGDADLADADGWKRLDDEALIGIWCSEDGKPGDVGEGEVIRVTSREWADRRGRGYLCTTEQ